MKRYMKRLILSLSLIVAFSFAAQAQDVGATVYGNDDAPIGTVTANDGTTVTVNTGKHAAPLPANLLAEREGKWTVNATKGQIDGMMAQQVGSHCPDQRKATLLSLPSSSSSRWMRKAMR